jgi:hypothetical protein
MLHHSASPLLAVAVALTAFGILTAPVLAQETGTDIPKNSYYKDPLTKAERGAIAEEENVTPNDGQASVPDAADDGVIPDAAIDQGKDAKAQPAAPADTKTAKKESEAQIILDQSKKSDKVTKQGLADCLKDWDPQSQMSKSEWAASCRSTLEYFPDGQ